MKIIIFILISTFIANYYYLNHNYSIQKILLLTVWCYYSKELLKLKILMYNLEIKFYTW